jgi:hypothetical protein
VPKVSGLSRFLTPEQRADQIDPADVLQVYRADPTGRYGGKDKLETQPTTISYSDVVEVASGLRAADRRGLKTMTNEELANRMLVEGRGDAGGSAYDTNKPRLNKIRDDINADLPESAGRARGGKFVATVVDKRETAERLGIPFSKAWIGTGRVTANYGGDEYAKRSADHQGANPIASPKNAELMRVIQTIRSGLDDPVMQGRGWIQQREQGLRSIAPDAFPDQRIGDPGLYYQKALLERLPKGSNAYASVERTQPGALRHFAENMVREREGIPTKPYGTTYVPDERSENFRRMNASERTDAEVISRIPEVNKVMLGLAGYSAPQEQTKPGLLERAADGLRSLLPRR